MRWIVRDFTSNWRFLAGVACSILLFPRSDCLCVNAVQEFPHGTNRTGIGCNITGKSGNGLVKLVALHNVEYSLHRLGLQERAAANKEIVLRQKPDEIEPELPGGCLDAETCVRHTARHISGHCGVSKFHLLPAINLRLVYLVQDQQLVEQ